METAKTKITLTDIRKRIVKNPIWKMRIHYSLRLKYL